MADATKAYLSTESPVKHRAVKAAFERVGITVETIGYDVSSDVPAQPTTVKETYDGAMNRHAKLRQLITEKTGFLMTVESGVIKFFPEAPWKGFEVVIVESLNDGAMMVGMDVGAEYPQEMLDKLPSVYPDLGILMQKEYGFAEKDPPLYLTHGKIPRADFIENALYKALVQMDIKA